MKRFHCAAMLTFLCSMASTQAVAADTPEFRVDPFWPKPLPNHWVLGQIGGIATDREFHWVHAMAVDPHGNIFTGDVDTGKCVQRFERIK